MSNYYIDRMIAERVMGWTVSGDPRCSNPNTMFVDSDSSIWYNGGIVKFSPSSSMDDAMLAVEEMRKRGWCFRIWCNNHDPMWDCKAFTGYGNPGEDKILDDDGATIHEAVCSSIIHAAFLQ